MKVYIHSDEKKMNMPNWLGFLFFGVIIIGGFLVAYCFDKVSKSAGIISILLYLSSMVAVLILISKKTSPHTGSYVVDNEKDVLYHISPVYVRNKKFHLSKIEKIKHKREDGEKYKQNLEYTRDENFLLEAVNLYTEYPERLEEYIKKKEINVNINTIRNTKVVEEKEDMFIISYINSYGKEKTKEISKEYNGLLQDLK